MATQPSHFTTLSVPAAIESIRPATRFLVDTARFLQVGAAFDDLFEVALSEILSNAVVHGGGQSGGTILCELEVTDTTCIVRVFDPGAGFDPSKVPLPALDRDAPDLLAESGYGFAIVRSVFPSIQPIWRNGCFGVELSVASGCDSASVS